MCLLRAFASSCEKKSKAFCALLLAAILILPPPAHAARFSGAYLLQVCGVDKKGNELVKGGHTACQAYIAGVLDYQNVLQSLKIAPAVDICVPENVSIADLHRIVLAYLQKHKEDDSFIAAPTVTMALYQTYPCHKAKRK
jgi:hypothetical protein